LNKEGKEEYAYQNTFAITTRMLGVTFAMHSDSKGLILPPRVAPTQVVIVPIYFEDSKEKVMKFSKEIENKLSKFRTMIDDRDNYKPGFKFNEHELEGIPLRIEIGPKEIEKKEVVLVRRDNGKKENVKIAKLDSIVEKELEDIQEQLLEKAKKLLKSSIVECSTLSQVKKAVDEKKIAFAPLCKAENIDEELKDKTEGAKVLNIPDEQPKSVGKCVISGEKADYWAYIGKSY
jgi:prolyl-tRNA synthetase